MFSHLEDGVGPLLPSHQKVAMVLELVEIEKRVYQDRRKEGRPPYCRRAMARALVAKAVLNVPTTKDLIERLVLDARLRRVVGFTGKVPSESTFSRGFAELVAEGVFDRTHADAVRRVLGEEIVHHACLDAASIPARERGPSKTEKKPQAPKEPKKRGRKKGQKTGERTKELKATERQLLQSARAAIEELPKRCDHGIKRGPKGYLLHWRGYKAHASVGDEGIPLAFFITSASVHDSLGAIPLVRTVSQRVGATLYDLMDKGYAGEAIRTASEELGSVPIVPPKAKGRGKRAPELAPDRADRYRNRTIVERFFSDLKDNHGGNFVFVKGAEKVKAHLMAGVLAIFGLRVLRI